MTNLQPSPALSILANPPGTFKGRKLGVLVSDGVDAALLKAVQSAFQQEGAVVKLVAPMVGGVEASDGSWIAADEKIDGGPSVVFDAVAILLSDAGAQLLAEEATARDFAADAFAHCKFIGHSTRRDAAPGESRDRRFARQRRHPTRRPCRRGPLSRSLPPTPAMATRSKGQTRVIPDTALIAAPYSQQLRDVKRRVTTARTP